MNHYGEDADLEKIRKDTTFDADRCQGYPDDIRVYFCKPGIQVEVIWVRTTRIIDGKIAGYLLNSPNSNELGVKEGDMITMVPVRLENGKVMALAEFTWIYG